MWVIKTGFIMMIYNSFELFLKPGKRFVFKSHLLASEKKDFTFFLVSSKIGVGGSENHFIKKFWPKYLICELTIRLGVMVQTTG